MAVAEIWAGLLGVDRVGARDHFFDLGGDSLLAVRAISRLAATLKRELPLHRFFERPTVEAVAGALVDQQPLATLPEYRRRGKTGLALSSPQQRLWFIDQLEGGSLPYHIPLMLRLRGELDVGVLRAALNAIICRHESLRTVFAQSEGRPLQQIRSDGAFSLQTCDLQSTGDREAGVFQHATQELATAFDLGAGPLIRGRLLQLATDEHVLLITMHHIASDGWSIAILLRELAALYEARCLGGPDRLQQLPIQYADYAQWQRDWVNSPQLAARLGLLEGAPAGSARSPGAAERPAATCHAEPSGCVRPRVPRSTVHREVETGCAPAKRHRGDGSASRLVGTARPAKRAG